MKLFANALLEGYQLQPNKIRIALTTFGDEPEQDLTLKIEDSTDEFLNGIESAEKP